MMAKCMDTKSEYMKRNRPLAHPNPIQKYAWVIIHQIKTIRTAAADADVCRTLVQDGRI